MIIDGRAIATDIVESVRTQVRSLGREPVVRAVVMNPTPATESYLRVKAARAIDAGMRMEISRLSDDATEEDVRAAIVAPGADSVIVQLPLPERMNNSSILSEIPFEKDADVLSEKSYNAFLTHGADALLPPVVGAIKEVLERSGVTVVGKKCVVIGNGRLVGQPVSSWLAAEGAMVTTLIRESFTPDALREADIIVSGAGSPNLITPAMVKKGVVIIDAGTSESNGAIVGDADPACADVASLFTPVPGGIGPIAVACLFKNAATLIVRQGQIKKNSF